MRNINIYVDILPFDILVRWISIILDDYRYRADKCTIFGMTLSWGLFINVSLGDLDFLWYLFFIFIHWGCIEGSSWTTELTEAGLKQPPSNCQIIRLHQRIRSSAKNSLVRFCIQFTVAGFLSAPLTRCPRLRGC